MTNTHSNREKSSITKLTITAMLTAVAVVLQYIEFPLPGIVPEFLKFDFSDLPELIGAFTIGPIYGVIIAFLKNLIHLPFGSSMGVGELSNFLLGAVFAFTAGMIYKHKTTRKGALLGCLAGAAAMALVSLPTNYFIVYPAYAQLWCKGNMDIIIRMYKAILPASDNLIKCLVIFNVPFTLFKGLAVAIITMLIYKPLSKLFAQMNKAFAKKK